MPKAPNTADTSESATVRDGKKEDVVDAEFHRRSTTTRTTRVGVRPELE